MDQDPYERLARGDLRLVARDGTTVNSQDGGDRIIAERFAQSGLDIPDLHRRTMLPPKTIAAVLDGNRGLSLAAVRAIVRALGMDLRSA